MSNPNDALVTVADVAFLHLGHGGLRSLLALGPPVAPSMITRGDLRERVSS